MASHITIDFALEQNRNVYVLPGSMFNPMTKGNLLRIQEGAKVVLNANDILKTTIFKTKNNELLHISFVTLCNLFLIKSIKIDRKMICLDIKR